jgi:hypothetical protein
MRLLIAGRLRSRKIARLTGFPSVAQAKRRLAAFHGVGDLGEYRKEAVEPGDAKDLEKVRVVYHQAEFASVGPALLERGDEYPESGRIDEMDRGQIQHDGLAGEALIVEGFLQLRSGIYVEIAADVHDGGICSRLGRDGEIHAVTFLPGTARTTAS